MEARRRDFAGLSWIWEVPRPLCPCPFGDAGALAAVPPRAPPTLKVWPSALPFRLHLRVPCRVACGRDSGDSGTRGVEGSRERRVGLGARGRARGRAAGVRAETPLASSLAPAVEGTGSSRQNVAPRPQLPPHEGDQTGGDTFAATHGGPATARPPRPGGVTLSVAGESGARRRPQTGTWLGPGRLAPDPPGPGRRERRPFRGGVRVSASGPRSTPGRGFCLGGQRGSHTVQALLLQPRRPAGVRGAKGGLRPPGAGGRSLHTKAYRVHFTAKRDIDEFVFVDLPSDPNRSGRAQPRAARPESGSRRGTSSDVLGPAVAAKLVPVPAGPSGDWPVVVTAVDSQHPRKPGAGVF